MTSFRGRFLLSAFLLAPGLLALPASAQEQDTRPGIAVMPFVTASAASNGESFEGLEGGLQQILLTELAQNSTLRIVERSALAALLEEQNLSASGRVDPEAAVRVGALLGAKYMIFGNYVDLFGDARLDARVVDVETSEVLLTEQVRDDRENLYQLLVDLSSRVVAGVDLPPLPAQVREARRSREIPSEAVTLYARAQLYADGGQTDRAIQLYRQITERFPDLTEAREALRQLGG